MSRLERLDLFQAADDSRRPLRIVHVVRQFAPGIGGIEEFVQQIASRQVVGGHYARVVTLDRIFGNGPKQRLVRSERIDGIDVVRIPYWGSQRYPIAPEVLAHVRDADVIHVHAVDFFADYLAATRAIHRKPMVLTTHGGYFHTGFAQRLKKLYFATVTKASLTQYGAITACSSEDARTFGRILDDRLKLIRNPVDVDKFANAANGGGRTMIYFGRFADNKRLDRLIGWFSGLIAARPGWRLIIAGKPMDVTVEDLSCRVAECGIQASVEIHPAPSVAELRVLIGQSSVYVCASSYEGFGLAAVEAASAGLFPVLSDIPPFVDTIEQLGFGCAVDFADQGGWRESYAQVEAGLAQFREQTTPSAVQQALEPFAWTTSAPKFEALYRDLLGEDRRRVGPLTIDVTHGTAAQTRILDAASERTPLLVAFCNAHSVNVASRDTALRDAMDEALVLNDGVGVDLASKALFGRPFPENLNGTDFVPALLSAAKQSLRVFLVGARPGVAEQAATVLSDRFGKVTIVGTEDGFFNQEEGDRRAARVAASGANLVLVALGQPRQEVWARRHFRSFNGPTLCVGALFDFLAGEVQRAPAAVRRMRLEWLFRLLHEPGRLARRYLLGNVVFLSRLAVQVVVGARA